MLNFSLLEWKLNEMKNTGWGSHTVAGQVSVDSMYSIISSDFTKIWLA